MIFYSQKDPRWASEKLGTCKDTIGQSGCKLTCLAIFAGLTPAEANKVLIERKGYDRGCLISDARVTGILKLEYNGKTAIDPKTICIAETNHYAKNGVPQHFFIYENGMMIDPLELKPTWKKNKYNIVSYRLIKPKEMDIYKDTISTTAKGIEFDYGDNMNESESKELTKKISDMKTEIKEQKAKISSLEKKNAELDEANAGLAETCALQAETIDLLEEGKRGTLLLDKWGLLIFRK